MLNSLSFARWRAMLPGLSLLCVLAVAPPVRTQGSDDPLNPHVSAHLSDVTFAVALKTISRTADIPFRISDQVLSRINPQETYNVDTNNGSFQDTLNYLLDQVDPKLDYHLENGAYVLEISKTPRAGKAIKKARAIQHTTYAEKDKPFEEAVRSLFFGGHPSYRIDPAVTAYLDPVTFSVEDATLDQKLDALLKAVPAPNPPLTYHVEKGVYVIAPKDTPAKAADPNTPIGLLSYHPLPVIKSVSISNERVSVALEQIFTQAGVDYAFAQPASVVASSRLNFAMRGVPLEQAVVHLLRCAPTEPMLYLSTLDAVVASFKPLNSTASVDGAAKQITYTVAPDRNGAFGEPQPELRHWFSFHHANLYSAFKCLVNGTHQNYTIDPAMRSIYVTASGSNLSLEAAISKLLGASPVPVQSSTKDNILSIEVRHQTSINGKIRP